MSLQHNLVRIWEELYCGTLCAVRDETTDDRTWDEADNTYSDGRQVMAQIRIEPWETSERSWEHNPFALGDGAVNEHPRGTICYISPINPADEIVADPPHQRTSTDFDALRRRLMEAKFDRCDDQDTGTADGNDEIK